MVKRNNMQPALPKAQYTQEELTKCRAHTTVAPPKFHESVNTSTGSVSVEKVLVIPFGCCSEEIRWTVGADYCLIIGTYLEPIRKELGIDNIDGIPAWKFLLNCLGKEIR